MSIKLTTAPVPTSRIFRTRKEKKAAVHQMITHLEVEVGKGKEVFPQNEVVAHIETGIRTYFLNKPTGLLGLAGKKVTIKVALTPSGERYLITSLDNKTPLSLLALPDLEVEMASN